ncbi:restriction endonuclease subunit S [Mesoflavibacter zeaxanthinifaciens]|uniref:restriction endonuclease subunit S n=1 Tax=Mesoflavibacter zeaxanthinifaciens TaxID=393060 RepID=UPI003A91AE90
MTSNYRKIGDFIQQVNTKNEDGSIELLLGVNLDKVFINSVANTIGTDMTKYKVIKKGQFGCKLMSVGRDKKLPISRLVDYENAIISSAYYVFEVVDENILNPEYLMMWFSRPESDRYLWFQSGGDVRGRITWDDLCQLPIKVPSIEKQNEIVAEYNTIVNRIKLNEILNQKLEDTAQALYKHWFVDFEFPNADSKPYKSSGGEMNYNEELDMEIPFGWEVKTVNDAVELGRGSSPRPIVNYISNEGMPWIKIADATKSFNQFLLETKEFIIEEGVPKSRLLEPGTLILANSGSLGTFQILDIQACAHDGWHIFYDWKLVSRQFMTKFLQYYNDDILTSAYGSVFTNLKLDSLRVYPIIIPNERVMDLFTKLVIQLEEYQLTLAKEVQLFAKLKDLILSKMSKVNTKTAVV